jgi:hypothetical protein
METNIKIDMENQWTWKVKNALHFQKRVVGIKLEFLPWHRLYAFFVKRLSVTLLRAIANGVNMRLLCLPSHSNIPYNPRFQLSVAKLQTQYDVNFT